ncbi:MAG: hypothetical protein B7Z66_11465 [Chromatiales bacterium 21-64-14]|nr:MAG: hypothetical protein B7Z66_11465 [Chromatiales bacterium 21-64-14]HQU16731.1 hypothetical protein [Gammaproteobacteria bacterium]
MHEFTFAKRMAPSRTALRAWLVPGLLSAAIVLPGCAAMQSGMMKMMPASMKQRMMAKTTHQMQALTPWKGYLAAHQGVEKPLGLLGGPIRVKLSQDGGGVFVALPDYRKLDPDVFGTPELPRAYGGTPGISGVPPMARGVDDGHYTKLKMLSPFGDKYMVMADGHLKIDALDATATDAARTADWTHMTASWKDQSGNTYEVKCCKVMAAHGLEYPTFGGVVTNTILHGVSRIGTPLMPSEFTYFAFWGMGSVMKNGKVIDPQRMVHGMLTEYVRTTGYRLGFDKDITPTRLQFHLMVSPFKPDMATGHYTNAPVNTGFTLPNGMPLPFWHVMFENLKVEAHRG